MCVGTYVFMYACMHMCACVCVCVRVCGGYGASLQIGLFLASLLLPFA